MAMQSPFMWGQGGQKLTPGQVKIMRELAAAKAARSETPDTVGEGLASVGDALLYNSNMARANEAESAGIEAVQQALADARATGTSDAFLDVMGNEWATPGQQLIAGELYKRSIPDWQTFESGGDILRWNQNDPNAAPSVFYDGPEAAPEAPELETLYDPETGLEYKGAWNPETQQFDRVGGMKAPSGTSLTVDPSTGTVSFTQGNTGKPLTEAQSKDTVYATRATGALGTLDEMEQSLLSLGENVAGNVPLLGNYMQSEDYQLAANAGKEFLASILRKDTGAAVTPSEEKLYGDIFLPRPGDKPAVMARKRQARSLAIEAIKAGMPPQAILNMEAALAKAGIDPNAPAEAGDTPTISSDADYEALPSGTVFIGPDGKKRKKP